jgi:hydrogenase nickel incorporation protein HypA/HybF
MHEYSITQSLVQAVEEELEARGLGAEVLEVHLKLGLFSGAVKSPVEFYFEMLTKDGRLAGSRLVIEETPLALCCNKCQTKWTSEEPLFRCGKCESQDIEITGGREMTVDKIVFVDEED